MGLPHSHSLPGSPILGYPTSLTRSRKGQEMPPMNLSHGSDPILASLIP